MKQENVEEFEESSFLDQMNILVENLRQTYPYVHIDEDKKSHVEQILRAFIENGRNALHIVSDFDFTMTMPEKDGQTLPSSYGVIETDEDIQLPDGSSVRSHTDPLRLKYRAIEHDVQMTNEEKIPHMVEWWRTIQSILIESNLHQSAIRKAVHRSKMELRANAPEFVRQALNSQVPIFIFSAGLGDVIKIFLEKTIPEFNQHPHLTRLISNSMNYDEHGKLIGFNENLIHSFNKHAQLHDASYGGLVAKRPNVILLGDTLGDLGMINGTMNLQHSLKIAFLNRSTPTKLSVYKSAYDIVICDNQTFDVPISILKMI